MVLRNEQNKQPALLGWDRRLHEEQVSEYQGEIRLSNSFMRCRHFRGDISATGPFEKNQYLFNITKISLEPQKFLNALKCV